ncbi:MAG: periplasmic heavy metal sensor [Syntrophobacter sp.]
MKENIKKILVIASFALNVFFVATYLAFKLTSISGVPQSNPGGPLFLQLDLSPDQLARFEAERNAFHARLRVLEQEIKVKQIELIELLKTIRADQQALGSKQKEIQQLQEVIQAQTIAHLLRGSAILTPEQRTRFFGLIKARVEAGDQACPPMLKPFGQYPAGRGSE